MKNEAKSLGILVLSVALSVLIFTWGVKAYHFPVVSQERLAEYLPWVATRSYPNASYRYWWILAYVIVPAMSLGLWPVLAKIWHIPFTVKAKLDYARNKIQFPGPLETTLLTLGLIFILFNFSYALFYDFFYNYHHLDFIAWPINDVLHGKFLLIDTKAQYGFLNIFLASLIFKCGIYFSHPNLHVISMTLEVVSYTCIYLLIRGLTKSKLWAGLGTLFTVGLHFYGVFPVLFPSEIYVWPGASAWRFFPAIPTILLVAYWHWSGEKRYFYLSQAAISVALFWNFESGISLFIGYTVYLLTKNYYENAQWKQMLRCVIKDLIPLGVAVGVIVGGYSLYTWVMVAKIPDWSLLLYYVSLFNNGFLQYPSRSMISEPANLPSSIAPIAGYLLVIMIALTRKYFSRGLAVNNLPILVFLATYGYGIYRYFIAKQVPSNLAAVIVPTTILATYGMSQLFSWAKTKRARLILIMPFLILYAMGIYRFLYWEVKLFKQRKDYYLIMTHEPSINYPPQNRIIALESTSILTIPLRDLLVTAKGIQRYTPNGERVAILADFDQELLMQAERVNIVDTGEIHVGTYTYKQVEQIVGVYRTESKYLFVEKRMLQEADKYVRDPANYGQSITVDIFSRVRDQYRFVEELPMVYVYEHI